MNPFDLTGKVCVVTGSRGFLGRPICAALAEAGARVVQLDMVPVEPGPVPSWWEYWWVDTTSIDPLEFVASAIDQVPDGLITLAGLDAKPGTNDTDPWRDFGEMLVTNLAGTANACKVFGSAMAEAGRGSIITVGSLYASHAADQRLYEGGFTKPFGYGASKSAVVGLTRQLAAYWAQSGVRVNCLSPGGIGSDSTPPAFRERFEQRVPLGRMGTPGDLVGAVQFLLSDASAYITGQELRVDGGCGLWP